MSKAQPNYQTHIFLILPLFAMYLWPNLTSNSLLSPQSHLCCNRFSICSSLKGNLTIINLRLTPYFQYFGKIFWSCLTKIALIFIATSLLPLIISFKFLPFIICFPIYFRFFFCFAFIFLILLYFFYVSIKIYPYSMSFQLKFFRLVKLLRWIII